MVRVSEEMKLQHEHSDRNLIIRIKSVDVSNVLLSTVISETITSMKTTLVTVN